MPRVAHSGSRIELEVIERLRDFPRPRRHPRLEVMSQYLEGELPADARHALEGHLRECARCRRQLASLAGTVRALGSIRPRAPAGLAAKVIAALRADGAEAAIHGQSADAAGPPVLTVVDDSGQSPDGELALKGWPQRMRAGFRYCLRRSQLRLTLPIALVAGVVLSIVNMGGMLMHGRIDVGVCVSCAIDFLVPFIALNLGLLMLLWLPRRNRL
jgi:anti-sigma factor RsiW